MTICSDLNPQLPPLPIDTALMIPSAMTLLCLSLTMGSSQRSMYLHTYSLHSEMHLQSAFLRVLPGPCLFLLTLCDTSVGVLAGVLVASTLSHPCGRLSDQIGVGLRGWIVGVTSGRCCPARGDGQSKICLTLPSRFLLRRRCTARR